MTNATLYQITARLRARQFMPTALSDFTTDSGTTVPATLALEPHWSLYSLDLSGNLAVFVRLPPDCDLTQAAFIPQTQFDAATAVLTLALDALPALSQALPDPANLIFLFSIGRCGSTLTHHILNTAPDTFALSEPRAFLTLALARHDLPADNARDLIAATTRFLYRPPPGQPHSFAIKLHSQCLYQVRAYHRAYPKARFLFLYRDAGGWANSFSRFLQKLGTPLLLDAATLARTWTILTADAPLADLAATLDVTAPISAHAPVLAAGWAHYLAAYRAASANGVPFHAMSYADLTSARDQTIRALLAHCGLSDAALTQALLAFDRDSQKGTEISRGGQAQGFGKADYDSLINTLSRIPEAPAADVLL